MRIFFLRLFFCAVLFCAGEVTALYVLLQGERISITANREPLVEILTRLAQSGVDVRIDPQVRGYVTAQVKDADVQDVLDELLGKFGYVLIWNVIEGPLGPLPKLSEVQVFFPGNKQKIQPLLGTNANYEVASGPSGGTEFVSDEILIGFKAGTRRDEVDLLLGQIGGTVIDSIPGLGIYRIRLTPGANVPALVQQLINNPVVAEVEPNYIVDAPTPVGGKEVAANSGAVSVPSPRKGVAPLAILDSGLMATEDLGKNIVGRYDALNPNQPLSDTLGHGTQMALIASGAVSPDADEPKDGLPLIAVRAFDDNGRASNFGLMRSLDYAIDHGARVVNMSWGTEENSDFLASAVSYAQSKGVILVAAAGNEPTQKSQYPAAYSGVVAVSALDASGELWKSSNYGDFVSVAAPGYASFSVGYKGPPGSYEGTSISSAYVSRALTLYIAKHPTATAAEAVQALRDAVAVAGSKGKSKQFGYGALDRAALKRLLK
jgi:thermitase